MSNNLYICAELATRPNIYGEYACKNWVVHQDIFSLLAITQKQAGEISVAIAGVLIVAWGIKQLAIVINKSNNPFG